MAEEIGMAEGREPLPPGSPPAGLSDLASRWIDSWNHRDVDALLAMADPLIELRPLRLRGLDDHYTGHDGIRAWMASITAEGHEHRIAPTGFTELDDGRALVEGTVTIGGRFTSPFSAVYDFADRRVVSMAHYFTPLSLLESIGVLAPRETDA